MVWSELRRLPIGGQQRVAREGGGEGKPWRVKLAVRLRGAWVGLRRAHRRCRKRHRAAYNNAARVGTRHRRGGTCAADLADESHTPCPTQHVQFCCPSHARMHIFRAFGLHLQQLCKPKLGKALWSARGGANLCFTSKPRLKHAPGLLGDGAVAAVVVGNGRLVLVLEFMAAPASTPAPAAVTGPPATAAAANAAPGCCTAAAAAFGALWTAVGCCLVLLLCAPGLVAARAQACSNSGNSATHNQLQLHQGIMQC